MRASPRYSSLEEHLLLMRGLTAHIWQDSDWPNFKWNDNNLRQSIENIRYKQGLLLGRMSSLGFSLKESALLEILTQDVIKTSEIEGEKLDLEQVRSSLARKLGIDIGALLPSDRNVDGIVEIMVDATKNYTKKLSEERLFRWHRLLFPVPTKNLVIGK